MKALVIATHPDDEVLGCGGVMARHVARGDEVHVLIVTRGAPEVFPPEAVERVREELRTAHRLLGVTDTAFLDFPAPKLDTIPHCDLSAALARHLRSLAPHTLYLPHHGDIHLDHRAVHHATLVAARPTGNCPFRRLLAYETLSSTEWAPPVAADAFVPTVFVDITPYLDLKLRAMACYQSQLNTPPGGRSLEALEALARLRGATVGCAAAEAFVLVREIEAD